MDTEKEIATPNGNPEGAPRQAGVRSRRAGEMSYKFQRLRERLRQAILSGELTGKLPGERALASKYNCNAKTLSKALTDLAAEGLLDRSIGRGTYVKGSAPSEPEVGPWLVLGGGSELDSAVFQQLLERNPRCQLVVGPPQSRPSFLNQFSGVVDLSPATPEEFLRDLVIRGIPVVVMGRESRVLSLDSVLIDTFTAVQMLARELRQLGHRKFAAVEAVGRSEVAMSLRQSLSPWAATTSVDVVSTREVAQAVANGVTALVCDSPVSAATAMRALQDAGIAVPGQVSVTAVGIAIGNEVTSGAYVPLSEATTQVARLLEDRSPRRPARLWLAPAMRDLGTTSAMNESVPVPVDGTVRMTGAAMQRN